MRTEEYWIVNHTKHGRRAWVEGMECGEIGRSLVHWKNWMKVSIHSTDQDGERKLRHVGARSYTALKTMLRSFIIYYIISEEPLKCSKQG